MQLQCAQRVMLLKSTIWGCIFSVAYILIIATSVQALLAAILTISAHKVTDHLNSAELSTHKVHSQNVSTVKFLIMQ